MADHGHVFRSCQEIMKMLQDAPFRSSATSLADLLEDNTLELSGDIIEKIEDIEGERAKVFDDFEYDYLEDEDFQEERKKFDENVSEVKQKLNELKQTMDSGEGTGCLFFVLLVSAILAVLTQMGS